MKRQKLLKELRKIAKAKGAEYKLEGRANHDMVRFDGQPVTLVGRHNDVPERTAKGSIKAAEEWTKDDDEEDEE